MFRQSSGALFQAGEQLRKGDAKSLRYLREIGEAEVGLATLDGAHERPVDATMIGERLLRVPSLQPELSYSLA